jgi:hypothetical protein
MTASKIVLNAASGVGGAGENVEDIFSTFTYKGAGSAQNVTTGIDGQNEGALVWIKSRADSDRHLLFDTARTNGYYLPSNLTDSGGNITAASNSSPFITSTGFSIASAHNWMSATNETYVSWTFRKAKNFFDIVTWTGDGSSSQTISHNLGSTPGLIICRRYSDAGQWITGHRYDYSKYFTLNTDNAAAAWNGNWNATATTFTAHTAGNNEYSLTHSGSSYVAYVFAHNNSDGGFGPDGDADIIKCGSYTGNSGAQEINLGFEAQWVLLKRSDGSDGTYDFWHLTDIVRGMPVLDSISDAPVLIPNASDTESTGYSNIRPTANGFAFSQGNSGENINGHTYIYMAIRRGPMATPTSGSNVFAIDYDDSFSSENAIYVSNFLTDMGIQTNTAGYNKRISTRFTPRRFLEIDNNGAESTSSSNYTWDFMKGWNNQSIATTWFSWMWKRAPGYFDVVAYNPTSTSNQTITHNLGVKPEMVWIKQREAISGNNREWAVGAPDILGINANTLSLNNNYANGTLNYNMFTQQPTATQFVLHGNENGISSNGGKYIAYLFATLEGVSKVGSVSHSGSSTDVDCGFSSGARFVLLKRTDATGDWYIWDSTQGIVSGNDPYLLLNSTAAQVTNTDLIDPLSSGFQISDDLTDGTYLFYAIA